MVVNILVFLACISSAAAFISILIYDNEYGFLWGIVLTFILIGSAWAFDLTYPKLEKCSGNGLTFVRADTMSEWVLLIEDGNPVLCKSER